MMHMRKISGMLCVFLFFELLTGSACTRQNTVIRTVSDKTVRVTASENVSQIESTQSTQSVTVYSIPENDITSADSICEKYGAEAVQAAVICNGTVSGFYNFGMAIKETSVPVETQTKFRVASLSKLVTDAVCLALVDRQMLDLDEDISTYYGYSVRNPYYPDTPITLRMLMTHTASVTDGSSFSESLYSASSVPMQTLLTDGENFYYAKPGTSHYYSNFSVAVVGSLCETVTGIRFNTLARQLFFEPLGVDASYVASELQDTGLMATLYDSSTSREKQLSAAFSPIIGQTCHIVQGGLYISAADYAAFLSMICSGGVANGMQLLSAESASALFSVHFSDESYDVGLGSFRQTNVIDGLTVWTHTGSAYGIYAAYCVEPVTGNGVVVITSGAAGTKDDSTEIYNICLDLIRLFYPV